MKRSPECDSCSYPTRRLKKYDDMGQTTWLCRICANTHAPRGDDVLQAIAFAANAILEAIAKRKAGA